jgi:hypothetical protein
MARRFGYFHLVAAVIVGLAAGVTLMKFVPFLGSFEECFVKEMRGQPAGMIPTVYVLCRQRHGSR